MEVRFSPSTIALSALILFGAGTPVQPAAHKVDSLSTCRICVLSYQPYAETRARWTETARHLSDRIPGTSFVVVPANYGRFLSLAATDSIDFMILNPALYIEIEMRYSAERLATLEAAWEGRKIAVAGGTVFMKTDRTDIVSLLDLKGMKIAATNNSSFESWFAILRELQQIKIDPFADLESIQFCGTSDSVVAVVQSGSCDAGFLAIETLERMARIGKLDLAAFRTIPCPKAGRGCPIGKYPLHSTSLYPGWAFAKAKHADVELSKYVAIELLKIEPDHLAAITGKYAGWTIPLNYAPVRDCLRDIKAPPFENEGKVTLAALFSNYWKWLIAIAAFLAAMAITMGRVLALNRQITIVQATLRAEVRERVAAEESLMKQAYFLQMFLDAIPTPIFYKSHDDSYGWCNKAFEIYLGLPRERIVGHTVYDVAPGDIAEQCAASDRELFETGGIQHYESSVIGADGARRDFLFTKTTIDTPSDDKTGIVGVIFDITELKRAEVEAQEREEKFRALFESSQDALMTFSPSLWSFTSCNRAAIELFHVENKQEFILLTPGDLSPERQPCGELSSVLAKTMIETAMKEGFILFEWVHMKRDGHEFPATVLLTRIEVKGERFLQGNVRDMTKRKAAEEKTLHLERELHQSQKLRSVGQLAAGIAHEINTPMQFVGDNVKFLRSSFDTMITLCDSIASLISRLEADDGSPVAAREMIAAFELADLEYLKTEAPTAIEQSIEGIETVSRIVRAMKEFSHPDMGVKSPVDINRAIQTTITVSRNEWKYVSDVETRLDPDLSLVNCLPGEINQVFLNIIVNAAHAIAEVAGDGSNGMGKITISTAPENGIVTIRIADTGPGIPETILPRIFDPFFTTKKQGKGSGQGLYIAHGIVVEQHGGSIDVETEVGKGTTFIIRLPVSENPNADYEQAGSLPAEEGSRLPHMSSSIGKS